MKISDTILYRLPQKTSNEVINLFIPENTPPDSEIELSIKIEDKNINIREFGAFLSYLDYLYGRFHQDRIYSYAHNRSKQLEISRFEKGSIDLIFSKILEEIDPKQIVFIYLALKFFPKAIRELIGAYKDYEEARLANVNRKLLKEQIKKEELLRELSNEKQNRIVKFIYYIFLKDKKKLSAVIRFLKNHLIEISIRIKRK
ncbi:MAG TPA: hypothetical protein VIH28_08725 [Ignavibacteriaceae bacterium]